MRLNDFEFVQHEHTPHGKVILIGMAEDGPTASPFRLLNRQSPEFLLGDNELSRTYTLLVKKGIPQEDIFLFRLNGQHAYAVLEVEEEPALTLQALTGHSADNAITVTVSEEGLTLFSSYPRDIIESEHRKDFTRTYRFDEHPNLPRLAEAITRDAALGLHNVLAEYNQALPSDVLADMPGPRAFSYGSEEAYLVTTDGDFPEGDVTVEGTYQYDYWQRFYHHLLGVDFDGESASSLLNIASEVLYFVDIPVEEVPELATLGGRIAKQKTEEQDVLCTTLFRTRPVPRVQTLEEGEYIEEDGNYFNGQTGELEPWKPYADQDEFVQTLKNLFTPEERQFYDMQHVQIVVGDERDSQNRIISGAAHHLVHLIDQQLTPSTNKRLDGFSQLHSPLDQKVVDTLSAIGYICIMESIRRHAVTSKVQSLYNSQRSLDGYYHQKLLSYIIYDIRRLLDAYIGEPLSLYGQANTEDDLSDYLQQYVDARLLHSFRLGERTNQPDGTGSHIPIELVMYGEVDRIQGSVQLNESGWEVDLWNTLA